MYARIVGRLALLLVVGCYQPTAQIGAECSPLGECPTGQRCVAGICREEGFRDIDARIDNDIDAPVIPTDGPPDALVLGPWSAPVAIPGVDSASAEGDASLTANRLKICFTSSRNGNEDLFLGIRATTMSAFVVAAIPNVNSASRDTSCEISADGSRIVFTSNRNGNFDVFLSLEQGGVFQPPNVVLELMSAANENDVAISPDGLTLLLSRNNDMFLATRSDPTGMFTTPVLVPELDVTGNVAAPSLTNDAATVYLHAGGTRDLYTATRMGTTFTTPVPITELNTAQRDAAPFVSADDRTLVFERNGVLMESTR